MKNGKFYKLLKIEIFLLTSLIISWLSISSSLNDIFYLFSPEKLSIDDALNFLRAILNLIIFPILLIIFFMNLSLISLKRDTLFIFALFYFLMQMPGLFFHNNSIYNVGYIISALNILIIFFLINIHFNKDKYFYVIIISLTMLLIITILNYNTFLNFFREAYGNSLYTFFKSNETFLGKDSPRSTGSSRTLLFILLISNFLFFKFFKKYEIIKNLLIIIILSFILLFQSRTTIALSIIFILFNYFYEKKFSIIDLFKYVSIYLILPILFSFLLVMTKAQYYENKLIKTDSEIIISIDEVNEILIKSKRPIDPNTFSSGRVEDWSSIIKKIDQSLIYGFGAQGDRFLIDQSASNSFLYAISSAGVLGLIFFILFIINSIWILIKLFYFKTKEVGERDFLIAIIIILLLARSLLESSFSVFSVDFILFYSSISYFSNFQYKKNNE